MNNILDFFYESGRVRGIRAQDFFYLREFCQWEEDMYFNQSNSGYLLQCKSEWMEWPIAGEEERARGTEGAVRCWGWNGGSSLAGLKLVWGYPVQIDS